MPDTEAPRIVVLGASAGGTAFFRGVLAALPDDFPAAVMIVRHLERNGRSMLVEALASAARMPIRTAEDGQPIESGTITVAPPNRHLLVETDHLRLAASATENGARPAIDVTLRSAAVKHGPRTIGCLGSGFMDDGVAGLDALRACGGRIVVQSPEDADVPELPENALAVLKPDLLASASEIGAALAAMAVDLSDAPLPAIPDRLRLEADLAAGRRVTLGHEFTLGDPTQYACPECGGNLWAIGENGIDRFRCTTGHAYSAAHLESAHALEVSEALWTALRALRERANLLRRISEGYRSDRLADRSREQADEVDRQADALERMLLRGPNLGPYREAG